MERGTTKGQGAHFVVISTRNTYQRRKRPNIIDVARSVPRLHHPLALKLSVHLPEAVVRVVVGGGVRNDPQCGGEEAPVERGDPLVPRDAPEAISYSTVLSCFHSQTRLHNLHRIADACGRQARTGAGHARWGQGHRELRIALLIDEEFAHGVEGEELDGLPRSNTDHVHPIATKETPPAVPVAVVRV